MSNLRKPRLKNLLDKVPPGFIVDTPWLRAQGIHPKSIHDYVSRGWLERIVRGVYRRPLPEGAQSVPENAWAIPLLSLQWIMNYETYLGGESALDLAGHVHYLNLGEVRRVHFYGFVPSWLKRLPVQKHFALHRDKLFDGDSIGIANAGPNAQGTGHALSVWHWPVRVSSPERAILEALDELPNRESFSNLDKIFEGLTTLRPKQLMTLLTRCRSVKVRRLFFVFSDRHRHPWSRHLDVSKVDLGSGPRALMNGGKIHPKYRIYVPHAFVDQDEARNNA